MHLGCEKGGLTDGINVFCLYVLQGSQLWLKVSELVVYRCCLPLLLLSHDSRAKQSEAVIAVEAGDVRRAGMDG